MPATVAVSSQVPSGGSLESRSAYVLGSKASLSSSGLFALLAPVLSPAGEVKEEDFATTVSKLEAGDAGDFIPMSGKDCAAFCLPEKCSRNNCPARPDVVKALMKGHLARKKDATVLVVGPKEHMVPMVTGVSRALPPIFSLKTPTDQSKTEIQIVGIVVEGGKAVAYISPEQAAKLDALSEGIRFAARLVDSPPNILHTDTYLEEAKRVASTAVDTGKVNINVIRGEELRDQGFGGMWNVGMAAPHPPALVVLSYDPNNATSRETVCWVGKGIIYDTGGLSIKGKFDMPSMKGDMGGSAAILAAFQAAIKIGVPYKLRAVLCLAENSVDSISMRPDDVIIMKSGKSVEVNNTDAEGRLVLGDGVHYAAKDLQASLILDMATLTGAQSTATGKLHAALLCNDYAKEQECFAAGLASGDLIYPIVYAPELFMQQAFKSEVADMKNSADDRRNALSSAAGHFIEANLPQDYSGPWIHVDMATPSSDGQRGTGWGVAFLLKLFNIVD